MNLPMQTTLHTTIRSMVPQFVVSNLEESLRFYVEQLGFTVSFRYKDFYAGLDCAGHTLHLKAGEPAKEERVRKRKNEDLDLTFDVDELDGLYEVFLLRDIEIIQPLREMPYGREFYICDPDGYIFAFLEARAGTGDFHD
jgi:catechol 2,3-dioxygenase-like lactoylglutathione lyase family enzyme